GIDLKKKFQRQIARRKKGSSNRYRARKLMRKSYQKLGNKKRDAANKITHVHAARNIILLSKRSTCGTQGTFNPAFGEEVRRRQKCCNADLVELGSRQIREGR
ncbi:MAG: hypothetical protein II832_00255, partial [Synergistaceae bacterium]|nr:hypothetical protein [Synergistaceae bacterium]